MSPKLNVADIIKKHLETLYDASAEGPHKVSVLDAFTFFVLPVVPAAVVACLTSLSEAFLSAVTMLFAIFAGLLFNLLVLTLDHARKIQREIQEGGVHASVKRSRLRSTQELLYNISFEVLVSVVAVVMALIVILVPEPSWAKQVLDGILVWLVSVFIMSLFMVLKRAHALVVTILD